MSHCYQRLGLRHLDIGRTHGYRCYEAVQFFDFDAIRCFKDAGCSLSEIKELLPQYHHGSITGLLDQKIELLEQQLHRLKRRRSFMLKLKDYCRKCDILSQSGLCFEEQPEEKLAIITELAPNNEQELSVIDLYVYACARLLSEDPEKYTSMEPPYGGIIEQETVRQGTDTISCMFTKGDSHTPRSRLIIKPQGLYARQYFFGSDAEHSAFFREFVRTAASQSRSEPGRCFAFDTFDYDSERGRRRGICYCLELSVKGNSS